MSHSEHQYFSLSYDFEGWLANLRITLLRYAYAPKTFMAARA